MYFNVEYIREECWGSRGLCIGCHKDDMMQHACQMLCSGYLRFLTTDDEFSTDASLKALVNTCARGCCRYLYRGLEPDNSFYDA